MSARPSKLPRPDPHWTFSANDLADTSPLAIIEWDAHFRVSVWSKRATELFGWSEEEVRGKHLRELSFVHKDDEARVWDVMERFYAGEMPWVSLQFRTTRKDGLVAHCVWYCTAIRDPSGKLACILTQVLDVTGREQALAQLEESERRFKATFEQAAVGIAHVSVSGQVIRANSRLGEIWGYTTQEVVEHGFADLTHPEDMGPDLDLAMQVLEGVIPRYSLEKRFKHKQGVLIWCALTVSLVRKPDGMPDYFIAVIEDISRRGRAEAERDALLAREQQARTEAEEMVRRRSTELEAARSALVQAERLATAGQLAAGVGHEINNPLSYVLGNQTFAIEELARVKVPTPGVDMEEVRARCCRPSRGRAHPGHRPGLAHLRAWRSDTLGPVDIQATLEFPVHGGAPAAAAGPAGAQVRATPSRRATSPGWARCSSTSWSTPRRPSPRGRWPTTR